MSGDAWGALLLGLLLGIRHATDADHVVAVATVVSEYRNAWRGIWVGASWGLGHSTPLLVLGLIVLLLREAILERYEQIAPVFEFGVGIMLVFLGVQVFWKLREGTLHIHEHLKEEQPHVHIHSHGPAGEHEQEAPHGFFSFGKPFFRLKSYLIGIVHSLAGSAAVMLLVLAGDQIKGIGAGLLYIALFGLGTILSMSAITLVMGIPFAVSGQYRRFNAVVAGVAGVASIAYGVFLMYELTLGEGLADH